jgi:DNA modification methylase
MMQNNQNLPDKSGAPIGLTPAFGSPLVVHVGDCREILRGLPSESVQCCVTSPPYWGLRDYGHADQIGQEATPEAFVASMVDVFREVRRVLKSDGTCWLNLGDTYAAGGLGAGSGKQRTNAGSCNGNHIEKARKPPPGLKMKDLCGIPWMVAFALRADGWYLRQDIIWSKPNPMPESVTDRCTKAHEYIFLLTKSERYYYDHEAVKEPAECGRLRGSGPMVKPGTGRNDTAQCGDHRVRPSAKKGSFNGKTEAMADTGQNAFRAVTDTRNKRSVWSVPTRSYAEAHFATYPKALITPCILAGTKPGDVVLDPFGGSGTTGEVALELGRRAELIELNPDYAKIIDKRTNVTMGLALA